MTGDRGAQIIILPEECESLCSALRQIRSVPVDASRILLQDLKVKAQVVKEVILFSFMIFSSSDV
jgi:RNA-binding protein YlmH